MITDNENVFVIEDKSDALRLRNGLSVYTFDVWRFHKNPKSFRLRDELRENMAPCVVGGGEPGRSLLRLYHRGWLCKWASIVPAERDKRGCVVRTNRGYSDLFIAADGYRFTFEYGEMFDDNV